MGVQGYVIFTSAWRERQVPPVGILGVSRNPKYPNLQASVEKHAIRQLYMYIVKNSSMDLFEGLIGEFEEPCTPYQKQPPSIDGGI